MGKSDLQLWNELVSEVERQMAELNAIRPRQCTFRGNRESFQLKKDDTSHRDDPVGTNVIVRKGVGLVAWMRLRSLGTSIRPVSDSGEIEISLDGYWVNRKKFPSVSEAALYLIDLLI